VQGKELVSLAAAKRHTVVLTADGDVYTWGHRVVTPRRVGLVGARDVGRASPSAPPLAFHKGQTDVSRPRAVRIAAGAAHTSCLTQVQPWTFCAECLSCACTYRHLGPPPGTITVTSSMRGFVLELHTVDVCDCQHNLLSPHMTLLQLSLCRHGEPGIEASFNPISAYLAQDGVVLSWRSADPELVVQEVGGPVAGKAIVDVSAGKYRTAVVTSEGDIFMWEGWSKPPEAAGSAPRLGGGGGKDAAPLQAAAFGKSPDAPRCVLWVARVFLSSPCGLSCSGAVTITSCVPFQ